MFILYAVRDIQSQFINSLGNRRGGFQVSGSISSGGTSGGSVSGGSISQGSSSSSTSTSGSAGTSGGTGTSGSAGASGSGKSLCQVRHETPFTCGHWGCLLDKEADMTSDERGRRHYLVK